MRLVSFCLALLLTGLAFSGLDNRFQERLKAARKQFVEQQKKRRKHKGAMGETSKAPEVKRRSPPSQQIRLRFSST